MLCECGGKVGVIDTYGDVGKVYRRRKCKKCGKTFLTIESIGKTNIVLSNLNFKNKRKKNESRLLCN